MKNESIVLAKEVFKVEAQAILALSEKLDHHFEKAIDLIVQIKGKVVLSGIGKSGLIARKVASTMTSTGTPAIFLHPSESAHGDLGVISAKDLVILFSYGGESLELVHIVNFCARRGLPMIAITGQSQSTLAKAAQIVLDISVSKEACPLNLAPTASTATTLAMGDALAMAVLVQKGFSAQDFSEYHPGGRLGAKLLTRVKDLMHTGDALPLVELDTPLKQVFSIMTNRQVRGVAGVVNNKKELVGVITDGDIMNPNPRTIDQAELAEKALYMMEQFKIQLLFVLDASSVTAKKPLGVITYQDLLSAKIK
jgi:arabinose-5-phosphate isomerase